MVQTTDFRKKKKTSYDCSKRAGIFQSSITAVKNQEFQSSGKAHAYTYPGDYNVKDCNAIK